MQANRYPLSVSRYSSIRFRDWLFVIALVVALLSGFGAVAVAEEAAPLSIKERLAKLESEAVPAAQISGDTAWMLTCAALVLMMTGPGLALFYSGLVRKKNVLGTMMQSFMMMGLISVLWCVYGYSLAFGDGNAFFGSFSQHFMMKDVGQDPSGYAPTVPHLTFMIFQLMFAIITPALITGAFAERMKFKAMLLFMALWATVVYFPLAHMVWGNGGFFNWFGPAKIPALDFAGGTVVHISSGVSALICAIVLGKRVGYGKETFAPHSVVLSFIGTCLLWVGWFGFNAGSALASGGLASSAFAATHFATAAAALAWTATEWLLKGKPSVLGACSGAVAGLVAITPAAGFVTAASALIIGIAAGVVCYVAVSKLKAIFRYDDSLDVFGIHGVGGTLGALLTGVFASSSVNEAITSTYTNAAGEVISLAGSGAQFFRQLSAVAVTWAIAIVGTFLLLMIVKALVGLRLTEEEERQGLDITQHGEEGYNW